MSADKLPEFYELKCVLVSGDDYPQAANAYNLGRLALSLGLDANDLAAVKVFIDAAPWKRNLKTIQPPSDER